MADLMTFPNTVEEFMDQYKITDTEQVYTNGTELVPIFRMKQWFEHCSERKKGKWTERKVIEDGKAIEEWQSARCSVCGKYHTTPYLYYFYDFAYCPWCGAEMTERRDDD